MNEVTKIHLGRQTFTIAVDAQKELKKYLDGIATMVGNDTETLEDVENRMAEILVSRGISGDKAILLKDVAYLQEQLGSPTDFGVEEPVSAHNTGAAPRKLFRDPKNGYIAGVSAGLAAYFGIDATIVRIVFVLLTIFGGSGIIIYLILWIFMPEAKTTADRLQMQGKPFTIDSLKEIYKNRRK